MKKVKIICVIIIVLLLVGISIFLINNNNKKLANIQDIQTDDEFENVTYDKVEDIWDDSVLGIITIEKIGLNATVKEGTSSEILLNYIGHIEETATYDGNIGLAGHNRGCENSYFARINELEKGDIIRYKTKFFDRIYVVDNIQVIYETDWTLLESTEENKLSLITCIANKRNQRLCVQATEKTCNTMDSELQ
ncbi:MAG: class D sortase [Clostridia bacterium]